jgi:creatinine amidohydrolase
VVISEGMAERAVRKLRDQGVEAYVLPSLPYAVTDFAGAFPGAVSVTRQTATALLTEICLSLIGQGWSRIAIANAHLEPEHLRSIREAVIQVKGVAGIGVLFPDLTAKRWGRMLTDEYKSGACHAGSFESSVVMARRPDAVREEIRKGLPANPTSLSLKIKEGATDFQSAGGDRAYFGAPAEATREEGESTLETLATILVTAITETSTQ